MQDVVLRTLELPVGVTVLGPATITSQWVAVGISIDKATWTNPADKMSLHVEFSTDRGSSWTPKGGFADEPGGGPDVYASFDFSAQANNNRRVQATVTVAGNPITAVVVARQLDGTEPRALA